MVLENYTLYRFRWLLYELVKRDLRLRYRGSVLGLAWTLLNPLLFMAVYTLVFSVFMRSTIERYPLFLLSGLIPWMWFSNAISTSTTSIFAGSNYIGKTLMPPELFVLVPVLSNGVNFAITMGLFFVADAFLGVNMGLGLLVFPLLVLAELCMTLGISMILAVMNVFYRDVQQIITYLLTALFFLTPIFYSRSIVPKNLEFLVTFSPLAHLVAAYQTAFYRGAFPKISDLAWIAGSSILLLVVGVAYFNGTRDTLGEQF